MRITFDRKPVLVALVFSAGLAAIHATAPHGSQAAPPVHLSSRPAWSAARAMRAPRMRLNGSTATNWSGYALDGRAGAFTDAQGSWIVPQVIADPNCSGANVTYSAAWVGIDGDNSNSVEQCGTEQDVVNGVAQYSAWYEMYPKGSVTIPHTVMPYDHMYADVNYNSRTGLFTLTLADSTQNWTYTTQQNLNKARRSSAEWIMEAPWWGGVLPLADFGIINYNGCTSTPAGTPSPITMVDASYTGTNLASHTKAAPGTWSAGSFPVTYFKCQ